MQPFYRQTHDVDFDLLGMVRKVTIVVTARHDDCPYDGDDPEDIAAFERGDFSMAVIQVKALYIHLEASDILGGCCYRSEQDLLETVAGHDMINNALTELRKVASETLESLLPNNAFLQY